MRLLQLAILLSAACCNPTRLCAEIEQPVPGAIESTVITKPDSSALEGLIIDTIIIDNREIYDTKDKRYDSFLFKTANSLHIVTKAQVIRRELLFRAGEPFSRELAEETARNLRSRYRLIDAWVETTLLPNGHLAVRMVTVDEWSLMGGLELNRDGNRTRYKVGVEERNLLGYNQFLAFDWVVQEGEENYVHGRFQDQRLFGLKYALAAEYNTDPLNELSSVSFGKPFYSLDQRLSYSATVARQGGRRDNRVSGIPVGYWKGRGDRFDAAIEHRWGSHTSKFGAGIWYAYHADRVTERRGVISSTLIDSLYHMPGIKLRFEHLHFLRLMRISRFTLLEDVTVNTGLEFNAGRAFDTDFKKHFYDYFDITGRAGRRFGGSLFLAEHQQTLWTQGSDVVRTGSRTVLKYYYNSVPFLTLAARAQFRTNFSDLAPLELVIGGTSGLRGYDEFEFSGERVGAINLETRWFPNIEILSATLGGVLFLDIGRAWGQEDRFDLRHLENSVGAGLRISLERLTRSEIIRIDVARTRTGEIELAFGTGQYF